MGGRATNTPSATKNTATTGGTPLPATASDTKDHDDKIAALEAQLADTASKLQVSEAALEAANVDLALTQETPAEPLPFAEKSPYHAEAAMAVDFIMTSSRHVRQAGEYEPRYITAGPAHPVKIRLPKFVPVKKNGEQLVDKKTGKKKWKDHPVDSHLFRADSPRAQNMGLRKTHYAPHHGVVRPQPTPQ